MAALPDPSIPYSAAAGVFLFHVSGEVSDASPVYPMSALLTTMLA